MHIQPMLCHDFEVNGSILKENGLDGEKVTAAYRKGVADGLRNLTVRGYVAERKGGIAASDFPQMVTPNSRGITA